MSLTDVKKNLIKGLEIDDFFNTVKKLYLDERNSDKHLIKALLELHAESKLNINDLYTDIHLKSNTNDFWLLSRIYESILPELDAPTLEVMECIYHLQQRAGENLSIGSIIDGFIVFCSKKQNRFKDAFSYSMDNIGKFNYLISASIIAGSSSDTTWSFEQLNNLVINDATLVRQQAYCCFSQIEFSNTATIELVFTLLEKCNLVENSDVAKSSLFRAIVNLGEKNNNLWERIEIALETSLKEPKEETLYAVSTVAAFNRQNIPDSIKFKLINALKNTTSDQTVILSNIEHLLKKLFDNNNFQCVEDLLEHLLNKDIRISTFGYFTSELFNDDNSYLFRLVTKWFLSGNSNLCLAVHDLLNDVSVKNIEINVDLNQIDISSESPYFLAKKAIGWLFSRPIIAASFILSIIEIIPSEKKEELSQLLFNPLLISYSGELREYLEGIKTNSVAITESIQLSINQLDNYFDGIEGAWGISELSCSQEHKVQYWDNFNKLMEEATEASPPSPLADLFTTQTILYGNSSAVYMHDGNGNLKRSEMKMSKHSHSMAVARLDTLDPESLNYMLQTFRMEILNNEINT